MEIEAERYLIAEGLPGALSTMPRPRGGESLADELQSLRAQGVDLVVSLLGIDEVAALDLDDEAQQCAVAGLEFCSHPVPDFDAPSDVDAADAFVGGLIEAIGHGRHVAIHCRGGIGRSSTIAGAVLVGLGWSATDAFELISEKRGYRVPEMDVQRSWVVGYEERIARSDGI